MELSTGEHDVHNTHSAWYESINPLRVDLVGDLAGKELFAIHGDALMLYCITKANVDLQDGFQLLHAVHAVETFLHKLRERDCRFHIIWFRDHEELCLPRDMRHKHRSRYFLTRKILVQHLQRQQGDGSNVSTTNEIQPINFEFHGLDDADFQKYLTNHAIRFFLCLDGATFSACSEASATAYISIAHHLASRGYGLAFINDIEFASSGVRSSVVSPPISRSLKAILSPNGFTISSRVSYTTLHHDIEMEPHDWSPWQDRQPLSAREWSSLYALCAMAKMRADDRLDDSFQAWSSACMTQLVLLRQLPLSQRSFDMVEIPDRTYAADLLSEFSEYCLDCLSGLPEDLNWDLFDLVDGRLLTFVLGKKIHLPQCLAAEVYRFAEMVTQMSGVDVSSHLLSHVPTDTGLNLSIQDDGQSPVQTTRSAVPGYGVLPFSHPILDDYLQDIRLTPDVVPENQASTIFKELSHWHNARTSIDIKRIPPPTTARQSRMHHKQMAATITYSASLTNASGRIIEPEAIVITDGVGNKPPTKHGTPKKPKELQGPPHANKSRKQTKTKRGTRKGGKELAMETAQTLQQKKDKAKTNDALGSWEQQCKSLQKEPGQTKRYLKTIRYLSDLSDSRKSAVGTYVSLYACNVLASMLLRPGSNIAKREDISALIWSTIQGLDRSDLVSETSARLFKSFAKALQLPPELMGTIPAPTGPPLPFPGIFNSRGTTPDLNPATIEFQLQHCGPFLDRSFDSSADARVPFDPDAWQRKVLDAIDAAKSLFVVAPTSAGKTFISFYAMKRVLQESNDGVLVYVAPTKALVNQIAAEIQARYSKQYGHDPRSVWAIHTRDYRVNNPTRCQILVTVPHILQIMLMAPANAEQSNSWSRRVKRIIFDEVHCIGQADDGVIWEQLLLLAPCPIIALSATVGNPLEFKAWLEESERAKGNELEMVVHSMRYSDLRKFLWIPPNNFNFEGVRPLERLPIPGLDNGSDAASRFSYIHPVASLINRNRGTLQDISLEPRDCLLLWKSMAKHGTGHFSPAPDLNPQEALPKLVRKPDVAKYETMLKGELLSWMNNRKSPFEAVRRDFQPHYQMSAMSSTDLQCKALPLLTDLQSQGALPAILFNYDRVNCEDFVFRLLEDLTRAEETFKAKSSVWEQRMADFEKWKNGNDKADAARKKASKVKSKGKRDEDDIDDDRLEEPSIWAAFDPNAPLTQFSFADDTKLANSELEEMIRSLRFKEINPSIIAALRRGIGVHHAGMNRKYRQTVEMLFRKGFLTVVFATGTLALGLNMPCKTVVFFGDSVYLTALNYHQAAGRAGRRGFDLLGNVVFVGMSKERVFEIMSSRLPDLRGHFPLSTTLVLRTLGLLHHTNNSDYSIRAVQSLLSQTRLYLGGPADQMAIKHHLRFSIEYLRRQHLLSGDGAPLNFAGLVGHLYFTEEAVFAFHSLLKEGYFHSLCDEFHRNPDAVLLKVVLVLSHIFCRISTRGFRKGWEEAVRKSPSVVFLPPLPDDALRILRQHNRDTLKIFKSYVGTYVEQHLSDKSDRCLPFTKIDAGASGNSLGDVGLLDALTDRHHLAPTKLRSPFDALSGFDDHAFGSIHELCSTVRSEVFLEESAIPFTPIYPDDSEGLAWNAYIFDFFKNGDMEALVKYNHIKRGDVWFRLKDFSLILATIVTSLTNFLDRTGGGDGDLAMMDLQDANDAHQEHLDALDMEGNLTVDIKAAQVGKNGDLDTTTEGSASRRKPKMVKIVDSWEDDEEIEADKEDEVRATSKSTGSQSPPKRPEGPGLPAEPIVPPAWDGDGEKDLIHVLRMFKMVQQTFDEGFRKIWS